MSDITDFNGSNNDKYFASLEPNETASSLLGKARDFYNLLNSNSYLNKLRNMWYYYHGMFSQTTHEISFTGEQGELVNLHVNHFRNIAQHMYNMVTSNRPIMEARAINTDYKSLSQTYLANGILDYYMREKGLEDSLKRAVELAIVLGAGFVKMQWNATAGEAYDIDENGQFNYEGEVEFSNLTPLDVVVDGTKEGWMNEWMLVRTFQNKYNLMAKYPEFAEQIKKQDPKFYNTIYRLTVFSNDATDDIPVYEFYHKRTESMPNGRYMLFVDSDAVLLDVPLPYPDIPVYRVAAGDILGTPYAYSPMFDIYPIQEGINALFGAIMTNQNACAVQNFFIPRGADINIASLEGGMNIIEANAKPEAINLTATAPETYKFLEMLIQQVETISGVNSVTRGNPEASLKSGAALALVQSMSLQFISGLQSSYVRLIEGTGTALIQILKNYAQTPKLVALVGRNNRALLKEFTGDQISAINRVVVDMGNPLSRSTAGRVQMAEQLAQMKLLTNPQQYIQIINTGRLDSAIEGQEMQLLLIKSENEKLMNGDQVPVSILDGHRDHILEHRNIFADPDLRNDPVLLQNANDHIQQHIQWLRDGDPDLLQLLGEQPLNPQPMPGQQLPGQPMGNQEVIQGSKMSQVQGAPNAQMNQMTGPDMAQAGIPNVPGVPAELLSNPQLQETAPGGLQ